MFPGRSAPPPNDYITLRGRAHARQKGQCSAVTGDYRLTGGERIRPPHSLAGSTNPEFVTWHRTEIVHA